MSAATSPAYQAAIAEIDGELAALAAKHARLTAARAALAGIEVDTPAARPAAAAQPRKAKATGTRRSRVAGDDPKLGEAKRRWERGVSALAIATELGLPVGRVFKCARDGEWQRPDRSKRAPAASAADATVTPVRTCDGCQQKTNTDPCAHCGAAWNREWEHAP